MTIKLPSNKGTIRNPDGTLAAYAYHPVKHITNAGDTYCAECAASYDGYRIIKGYNAFISWLKSVKTTKNKNAGKLRYSGKLYKRYGFDYNTAYTIGFRRNIAGNRRFVAECGADEYIMISIPVEETDCDIYCDGCNNIIAEADNE